MLKNWIEEIRKFPDLYETDSWKYQISGNVIEISILPAHLIDKSTYRCAVIAVGRVLKALSCYIERQQYNFHIQSFPTLENPGVVASVRVDENREFLRTSNSSKKKPLKKRDPETVIQTLAKQYHLDIQKLQKPEELQVEGIDSNDINVWFGLYSTFNNPFTWLNIGYCKESILKNCHGQLPPNAFKIVDFCDDSKNPQPGQETTANRYLQSIVGIHAKVQQNK